MSWRLVAVSWLLLACSSGASLLAAEPQWIWSADPDPSKDPAPMVYFRTSFQVDHPNGGTIEITADNKYSLWINNERIGAGFDWQQLDRYDIKTKLVKGKNVIALMAQNEGGPAGLVARVTVQDGTRTVTASTGANWKTSNRSQPQWWSAEFNDQAWPAAHVLGEFGKTAPWGNAPKSAPVPVQITFQKQQRPAGPFQLVDGDRVVFLGDTLIERAQASDYIETRMTARYPNRHIKFRNLGWSADNVFGDSRAGFGSVADGYEQLKQRVFEARPTVVILGYGGAASGMGAAGLKEFEAGLERLLNLLEETHATIVVLSPLKQEDLGPPLPDPAPFNLVRHQYAEVLKNAAQSRAYPFVDLFTLLGEGRQSAASGPLTDNAVHLTAFGYWEAAAAIETALGWDTTNWTVEIDVRDKGLAAGGTKMDEVRIDAGRVSFQANDAVLPPPPAPPRSPANVTIPGSTRTLKVSGLTDGKWVLKIDGKALTSGTSKDWAAGKVLPTTIPEVAQAEKLRHAIVAKNQLFFHRWRPQNETYLFGFRKHEQGNNAKEIPMFDPLIEKAEAEVNKLKIPVRHHYELIRE